MRVKEYLEWADSIFSHVDIDKEVIHFKEEVQEFLDAINTFDRNHIGQEMSDVIMLALWIGHRFGLDPEAEFEKKHQINLNRKWRVDPDGCMRHVK